MMKANVHFRPISRDWCNQSDDPGDLDDDDDEEEEVDDVVDDEDRHDGILVFPETSLQASKLS